MKIFSLIYLLLIFNVYRVESGVKKCFPIGMLTTKTENSTQASTTSSTQVQASTLSSINSSGTTISISEYNKLVDSLFDLQSEIDTKYQTLIDNETAIDLTIANITTDIFNITSNTSTPENVVEVLQNLNQTLQYNPTVTTTASLRKKRQLLETISSSSPVDSNSTKLLQILQEDIENRTAKIDIIKKKMPQLNSYKNILTTFVTENPDIIRLNSVIANISVLNSPFTTTLHILSDINIIRVQQKDVSKTVFDGSFFLKRTIEAFVKHSSTQKCQRKRKRSILYTNSFGGSSYQETTYLAIRDPTLVNVGSFTPETCEETNFSYFVRL